jgi:hypothetical protein
VPLSTVIPSQPIEWTSKWWMPAVTFSPASNIGSAGNVLNKLATPTPTGFSMLPCSSLGNEDVNSYASAGTAGNYDFARRLNRRCIRLRPTGGGVNGAGWRPPEWFPPFDAAQMNPGAFMIDAQVVAVFDWHVSFLLAGATPGWANDTSPLFFLPHTGAADVATSVIGGVGPHLAGFGVMLNNVGGAPAFEYVAWSGGAPGSVLERVTIGASIVPNITNWNTFRFIVSAAASGRAARLTVQANGRDVVVNREFGSGLLSMPPTSIGLLACAAVRGVAGDDSFFAMDCKLGRFLPDGTQLQDQ